MDIDRLKFLVRQRFIGFDVPESPWFDSAESTDWFLTQLAESQQYLEFGAGGSTYAAARLGVNFTSVDSDPYFIRCVRKKIRRDGLKLSSEQKLVYADIGPTGAWGRPVGEVSLRRQQQFASYSDASVHYPQPSRLPDLVLVDGRFRVACALKTIRLLQSQPSWQLVVDDYTPRPEYHRIERYAKVVRYVGRMAVFGPSKDTDLQSLDVAIEKFEYVPD